MRFSHHHAEEHDARQSTSTGGNDKSSPTAIENVDLDTVAKISGRDTEGPRRISSDNRREDSGKAKSPPPTWPQSPKAKVKATAAAIKVKARKSADGAEVHEGRLDPEEYQHAKKKLKKALTEHYRYAPLYLPL